MPPKSSSEASGSGKRQKCIAKKKSLPPSQKPRTLSPAYANRELLFEHNILKSELRGEPDSRWTLDYLAEAGFEPLYSPPELAYPKFVRQFYQNLEKPLLLEGEDQFLETAIEGETMRFTVDDICDILDLPSEPPEGMTMAPLNIHRNVINSEMCHGMFGAANSSRRIYLPEKMWLLDSILKVQLFPIGHKQERVSLAQQALYAAFKNQWFNPGWAIFETMWEVKEKIEKGGRFKNLKLPFPRFITLLIRSRKASLISPNVLHIKDNPPLGSIMWRKSRKALQKEKEKDILKRISDGLHVPPAFRRNVSIPSTAASSSRATPSRAPQGSTPFVYTEAMYTDYLNNRDDMGRRMVRMETILEGMLRLQFPDQSQGIIDSANAAASAFSYPRPAYPGAAEEEEEDEEDDEEGSDEESEEE